MRDRPKFHKAASMVASSAPAPHAVGAHGADMPVVVCNICNEAKPHGDFYAGSLRRSFYWRAPGAPIAVAGGHRPQRPSLTLCPNTHPCRCKRCSCRSLIEKRRADPASRLASRLRTREKRLGCVLQLRMGDIRRLLSAEDPRYVAEDLVTLVRVHIDEPLSMENVALKRLGTILNVVDASC